MSDRSQAFIRPLSPDWQPKVGEHVYLKGAVAYGHIKACLLRDLYLVEYNQARRIRTRQFVIDDLRPVTKASTPKQE